MERALVVRNNVVKPSYLFKLFIFSLILIIPYITILDAHADEGNAGLYKNGTKVMDFDLETDQAQKVASYKEIAQAMGIRGYQKQEDVYGFIDLMVTRLAEK